MTQKQKNVLPLLRTTDGYPHREAVDGIVVAGDAIVSNAAEADVALTWNDYGPKGAIGHAVAGRGGVHAVMENGYVARERGYYLLERGGFNGSGETLYSGMGPERWERLGVPIEPWRKDGDYVLVVGQRGGAYNSNAMANDWPETILRTLRATTDRPIKYRPHPARQKLPSRLPENTSVISSERPLDEQIIGARVVVGWTSTALVRALILGVPVVYRGPTFVLGNLATVNIASIEEPADYPEREQAFWDLAWRQWHVDELRSGEAWCRIVH